MIEVRETKIPNGKIRPLRGWKRIISLIIAGILFFLGFLGVLLPGLPATPFLLLTSYFLVRASPRLNELLMQSKFFGPILQDWQNRGGVRPHTRFKAITLVAVTVSVTLYLSDFSILIKGLITVFASIGVLVILRLPSAK